MYIIIIEGVEECFQNFRIIYNLKKIKNINIHYLLFRQRKASINII